MRLPLLRSFAKLPNRADLQTFWSLLVTDEMRQNVINLTNVKTRKVRTNFSDETRNQIANTNLRKLEPFLGLY